MVDNPHFIRLRQTAIFGAQLAVVAIVVAVLAHFRTGLIVLRAGFAVFNVLSFFYCLSLVGQKAWETSARFANSLGNGGREASHVECN
jgi:hypothetical protein